MNEGHSKNVTVVNIWSLKFSNKLFCVSRCPCVVNGKFNSSDSIRCRSIPEMIINVTIKHVITSPHHMTGEDFYQIILTSP